MEARSAGVAVVAGEALFADAGPSVWVGSAGVIYGSSCAALTIDDLSGCLGLSVVVVVVSGVGGHRVTVGEVDEAAGAGVAVFPGEVWFAEAAAGQILAGPVCELGLTVTG